MFKRIMIASSSLFLVLILLLAITWNDALLAKTSAVQVTTTPNDFCANVSEIPWLECVALVALYNSTNGSEWNHSWLVTTTPCSWHGISCFNGSVYGLRLNYNKMVGSIPPELGNLSNLHELDLYSNQLSGSIPPELGKLANLHYLNLDTNQLSGSIPPELGKLSNLIALNLDSNQLSGSIPPELDKLINLQMLLLGHNRLNSSIPPELENLINLQRLDLNSNQLSESIPPELEKLGNLAVLNLDNNQLSGSIPPELGKLVNLVAISLNNNQLSGSIPPELGKLTNLHYLNLDTNQLSGSIPPELGNLANLAELNLSHNQLNGNIPHELGNLADLAYVYLSTNYLSGSIPPELGKLTNLSLVFLDSNQLSGKVTTEFCDKFIKLSYNKLNSADDCIIAQYPLWGATQTMAPTQIQATALSNRSVQISWQPISYTADGGYYEVFHATTADALYSQFCRTSSKTVSGLVVNDLAPGEHYFRVRTFTPNHPVMIDGAEYDQPNDLTSENSSEVAITLNFQVNDGKTDSAIAQSDFVINATALQASIAGRLFDDANGNGQQDVGEAGVFSATLALSSTVGNEISFTQRITTTADGDYQFNNVPAGNYKLQVALPAGYLLLNDTGMPLKVLNNNTEIRPFFSIRAVRDVVYLPIVTTSQMQCTEVK